MLRRLLLLAGIALLNGFDTSFAAQTKPAWQAEWEKTLEAAKKEGQLSIYISGYEENLPDFQKEYPEIKVAPITGRGSQIGQRLLAERRADKFLADLVSSGGVTTYQQLFPAKVFDPIKPALLLTRGQRPDQVVPRQAPLCRSGEPIHYQLRRYRDLWLGELQHKVGRRERLQILLGSA